MSHGLIVTVLLLFSHEIGVWSRYTMAPFIDQALAKSNHVIYADLFWIEEPLGFFFVRWHPGPSTFLFGMQPILFKFTNAELNTC